MSAIIAGKSCKSCKREYWSSLGNPKWFMDITSKGHEAFVRLLKQGKCLECLSEDDEFLDDLLTIFGGK